MPYAMKVTRENISIMIENAKLVGFDLSSVEADLEDALEQSMNLYQITDGNTEDNNITFTNMKESDFFRNWKFIEAEEPNTFRPIVQV